MYYTKEDITEYIGRNCILQFLFQKVKLGDWAWNYLRNSGDRYIFAAVKKGVDLPLPDYIEIGVDTVGRDLRARRSRWNEKADEAYALPTEEGLIHGNISNLIYQGSHYLYIIHTDLEQDFAVYDEDLWNMGDRVGLIMPVEKMTLS